MRYNFRRDIADAGMQRAMGARRILVGFILKVAGQDQRGHRPPGQRNARGAVDEMPYLRGCRSLRDIGAGHVLEHRDQIEFLLVLPAQRAARLLAGDGKNRLMIQQRVVQAGDQVRRTGA